MQLKKNWLKTDIGEARDVPFFAMPPDRSTEAVHYNIFNKTICVCCCYMNSSSGHLFIMCGHCYYTCMHNKAWFGLISLVGNSFGLTTLQVLPTGLEYKILAQVNTKDSSKRIYRSYTLLWHISHHSMFAKSRD